MIVFICGSPHMLFRLSKTGGDRLYYGWEMGLGLEFGLGWVDELSWFMKNKHPKAQNKQHNNIVNMFGALSGMFCELKPLLLSTAKTADNQLAAALCASRIPSI